MKGKRQVAGRRGACTWRWGSDRETPLLESGRPFSGLRLAAGRCRKSLSSSLIASQLLFQLRLQCKTICFCPPSLLSCHAFPAIPICLVWASGSTLHLLLNKTPAKVFLTFPLSLLLLSSSHPQSSCHVGSQTDWI